MSRSAKKTDYVNILLSDSKLVQFVDILEKWNKNRIPPIIKKYTSDRSGVYQWKKIPLSKMISEIFLKEVINITALELIETERKNRLSIVLENLGMEDRPLFSDSDKKKKIEEIPSIAKQYINKIKTTLLIPSLLNFQGEMNAICDDYEKVIKELNITEAKPLKAKLASLFTCKLEINMETVRGSDNLLTKKTTSRVYNYLNSCLYRPSQKYYGNQPAQTTSFLNKMVAEILGTIDPKKVQKIILNNFN